jgi:hypothetical protein
MKTGISEDDAQKAIVESPRHDRGMATDDESRREFSFEDSKSCEQCCVTNTKSVGVRGGSLCWFLFFVRCLCSRSSVGDYGNSPPSLLDGSLAIPKCP